MSETTNDVVAAAARIGLPSDAVAAVGETIAHIAQNPALAERFDRLAALLRDAPPDDAVTAVEREGLEELLGVPRARAFYLCLVLTEIAAAEARHRARDVSPEISRATLADIGIWVAHYRAQLGYVGITKEIVGWSQRYLRGELYRIGILQFDAMPFDGSIRAYRERTSRRVALTTLDGTAIDPTTGDPASAPAPPLDEGWDLVLEPGVPVLDMHIPAGTKIDVRGVAHAIRDAYRFFETLRPDLAPVGSCGEAWLLDPQMRQLLPNNVGLHGIQMACSLYPSTLREEKTITRLFGPDVTRADLPSIRFEGMTSLHRAVIAFLGDPQNHLRARGGLLLREELDRILALVGA